MSCSIFPDPSENKVQLSQSFNQITLITEGIYALQKHALTHALGGNDELTPQAIGAQPSGNYVDDNDYRLDNSREPLIHKNTHAIGGTDELTPEDIGAQPSGNYVLDTDPRLIDIGIVEYNELSDDISELLNVKRRIAKAWVNFNGVNIVTIRSSLNVSSITDNGTGDYTINFSNPFLNTNYCFTTWARDWNTDNYIVNNFGARSSTSKSTGSIRLFNNYIANALNYDSLELNAIFFAT